MMEKRTEDTAQLQKVSESDGERPLEKEQGWFLQSPRTDNVLCSKPMQRCGRRGEDCRFADSSPPTRISRESLSGTGRERIKLHADVEYCWTRRNTRESVNFGAGMKELGTHRLAVISTTFTVQRESPRPKRRLPFSHISTNHQGTSVVRWIPRNFFHPARRDPARER